MKSAERALKKIRIELTEYKIGRGGTHVKPTTERRLRKENARYRVEKDARRRLINELIERNIGGF